MSTTATGALVARAQTSRLTLFAFLWACQALVHHEFYQRWLHEGDWTGWLVAVSAIALLLRPSSLARLAAHLVSSVIYNVGGWPSVKNHILVETLIDVTILIAICSVLLSERSIGALRAHAARERVYETFAPVLRAMLVVMYAFAFLSKLNRDFLDPSVSCVSVMYEDLLERLPLLGTGEGWRRAAIWATLAIEGALPVFFAFRRTWSLAVVIGLPFHFMLGLIGHRTFSALAYALYGLFVMDDLVALVGHWRTVITRRLGAARLARILRILGIAVVFATAGLIAASAAGHYRAGVGPFRVFRIAWGVWGIWSLAVMAAYLAAVFSRIRGREPARAIPAQRAPVWMHAMTALVVFNGTTQYLGAKTETCFTMYSNLRTEAARPNHLFLPALRLAHYQDDLVEIVASDHPELQLYAEGNEWITWFEFRRFTSETREDFWVLYRRNDGDLSEFCRKGCAGNDPELERRHPLLARKLLFFRPVSLSERVPCRH